MLPRLDTREYLRITTTMHDTGPLHSPFAALADFCRRYQVRELALFGSMPRQEPRPDSDVDLLVSFAPAARVTFWMKRVTARASRCSSRYRVPLMGQALRSVVGFPDRPVRQCRRRVRQSWTLLA